MSRRYSSNRIGDAPEVCGGGRFATNCYLSRIRRRLTRKLSLVIFVSQVCEFERMAREGSSDSEYAMLDKDILLAYLMCSLCNHIISNPTAIIECLHIFCQECIMSKIINENCHHCPQCKEFIGINPLSKIRPDHNKQRLIDAICALPENPTDVKEREENRKANVTNKDGSPSTLLAYPEVIEGSFSSAAIAGSNFRTSPTGAIIRTKKRSVSNRKRRARTSDGHSGRSEDPYTGSPEQAKAPEQPRNGSGKTNVLNFDLNMSPPESPNPPSPEIDVLGNSDTAVERIPEDETLTSGPERRPITIVYALPYPAAIARPCRPPKKTPIPPPTSSAHRSE